MAECLLNYGKRNLLFCKALSKRNNSAVLATIRNPDFQIISKTQQRKMVLIVFNIFCECVFLRVAMVVSSISN